MAKKLQELIKDKKIIGGKTYFLVGLFKKRETARKMVESEKKWIQTEKKEYDGSHEASWRIIKQGTDDYAVMKWVGKFKPEKK